MPDFTLKKYHVDSFAGGLDVRTTPLRLATTGGGSKGDRLTVADDMKYTTDGGMTKRFGTVPINAVSLGSAITGGVQFRKSNGEEHIVLGTRDGRLVDLHADGSTSLIQAGYSTNPNARYRFAIYNDLLHIVTGYDVPHYWDGVTTPQVIPGTPFGGQVVVAHANRLFMTQRDTSTLFWSKLNNSLDWSGSDDAGKMDVQPQDNSTLIDLVASIQELVLLKGNRPYRLQGIGPATGYTITDHLVPTTGSVGAVSTMGAQFALNNVWYVSRLGLHGLAQTQQFGDLQESFLSDKVESYFRLNSTGINAIALNRLALSVLRYDSQENVLYLTADTDNDGQNDTTLVYDLLLKGWAVWHHTPWASLWMVRNAVTGAGEVWAGDYTGTVRALNRVESTETVIGRVSHITACGEPGILKSPRYGFFYFNAETGGTARITTRMDFGMTGGQAYTVPLRAGGDVWGTSFTWGTSTWGSRAQTIARIDMSGVGEVIETTIENMDPAQPWTLLGYEYFYRDRRAIRRPLPA